MLVCLLTTVCVCVGVGECILYSLLCPCNSLLGQRQQFHSSATQVMDNTICDGGFINNWKFSDDFVKAVYEACVAAGVDYMDVGYFSTPGTYTDAGPWRHCRDADLRRVMRDNETSLKLSARVDLGRIDADDIPHYNDTLIDMVRVAFYDDQVEEAVKIANACTDKGFEVDLLFMALSSIGKVLLPLMPCSAAAWLHPLGRVHLVVLLHRSCYGFLLLFLFFLHDAVLLFSDLPPYSRRTW